METVIVERTFEEPVDFGNLQALEDHARWCLDLHRVQFLQSFVSPDRRRIICIYEAPDAESVRIANQTAKLPFDRVWTASVFQAPAVESGAD
jgi:hypothetical protein